MATMSLTSCKTCFHHSLIATEMISTWFSGRRCYSQGEYIPGTMRAWQSYEYGDYTRLSLNEAARTPHVHSPDLLLIKVKAASINPMDVRMLAGYGSSAFRFLRENVITTLANVPGTSTIQKIFSGTSDFQALLPQSEFPLTIGRDFSGVVVRTGLSSLSNDGIEVGDEVFGAVWPFMNGTLADYILVPRAYVTKKPKEMSHIQAASIPYAGLTAYTALAELCGLRPSKDTGLNPMGSRTDPLTSTKRVLIIGASGGVGIVAAQLCLAWGHHVSVTCPDIHVPRLQDLGVHEVIPRSRASELIALHGAYNVVLDCVNDTPLKSEQIQDRQLLVSPPSATRFVSNVVNSVLAGRIASSPFTGEGSNVTENVAFYVTLRQPLLRMTDEKGVLVGLGQSMTNWLTTNWDLWRSGTSGRTGFVTNSNASSRDRSWWNSLSIPNPLMFHWSFFRPSGANLSYLCELWRRGVLQTHVCRRVYHFEEEVPKAVAKVARVDRDVPTTVSDDPLMSAGVVPEDTFGKTVVTMESDASTESSVPPVG